MGQGKVLGWPVGGIDPPAQRPSRMRNTAPTSSLREKRINIFRSRNLIILDQGFVAGAVCNGLDKSESIRKFLILTLQVSIIIGHFYDSIRVVEQTFVFSTSLILDIEVDFRTSTIYCNLS
jgi:hypothetical protein